MMHRNGQQRHRDHEIVDADDEEIVSLGNGNIVTSDNTGNNCVAQPTSSSGQVVDGKNTLKSVVDTETSRTSIAFSATLLSSEGQQVPPTLPTGVVITAKNTLQSFDSIPGHDIQQAPLGSLVYAPATEGVKRPHEATPIVSQTRTSAPSTETVVAVAIEENTNIVRAELAPELLSSFNVAAFDSNDGISTGWQETWYKKRGPYLCFAIVALIIAMGLGLYFGLRDDSSEKDMTDFSNFPTPSMVVESMQSNLTIRENVLTSYINNITLSGKLILPNGTSPASMALAWMINNDTTLDTSELTSIDCISCNAIGFQISQRYPLLAMWFQQTDTAKWDNVDGWLENPNECYWHGISCDVMYVSYYDDYFEDGCNGGTHNVVTKITFNLIGSYVGAIPVDIGLLSHLQHFEIKNTRDSDEQNGGNLEGTLPESIGQWTALTYFDVSQNNLSTGVGLTGTLPKSISQWTVLTHFDVSFNILSGKLPEDIGQWTALSYFNVDNNDFTGTLPGSIGQWTVLKHCVISANTQLTGTLPDSIGQWTELTYFDFSVNFGFAGTLPDSIGQWTELKYFSSYSTHLSGSLPISIGLWTELRYFNGLSEISGTLPDDIGQWTALTYFHLSSFVDSGLTGSLPDTIGNWTSINSFYVDYNSLTGTLPESIGQWTKLSYFSVGSNNLNGTIPLSIGNWSLIKEAFFYENMFTGSMPDTICPFLDQASERLWVDCEVSCMCCTDEC